MQGGNADAWIKNFSAASPGSIPPYSLAEMSNKLHMPDPTARALAATLIQVGFLKQDPFTKMVRSRFDYL
jgi:DNA-binding IclR family transcriptional regulator